MPGQFCFSKAHIPAQYCFGRTRFEVSRGIVDGGPGGFFGTKKMNKFNFQAKIVQLTKSIRVCWVFFLFFRFFFLACQF